MITIKSSGSFRKTERFLSRMKKGEVFEFLETYARLGTQTLSAATPVDSGLTAASWTHEVFKRRGKYTIVWRNTNVAAGTSVAILIQYGHGTGTGGWVEGRDFINPAIQPLFDKIANDVWEKVKHE